MKKIKLIIFPGYYVPHIGGLETHVDEFVKYLSVDENYDIYIFAPNIPLNQVFFTVITLMKIRKISLSLSP